MLTAYERESGTHPKYYTISYFVRIVNINYMWYIYVIHVATAKKRRKFDTCNILQNLDIGMNLK